MSHGPSGGGTPYGAPAEKAQGLHPRSLVSLRAAREQANKQQFAASQSDSERRYVSRVAQQLPEPFKQAKADPAGRSRGPQYEEDRERYFAAPARHPLPPPSSDGQMRLNDPPNLPASRLPRPQQAAGQPRSERPTQATAQPRPPQESRSGNAGRMLPPTTYAESNVQADMLSPNAWPLPTSAGSRARNEPSSQDRVNGGSLSSGAEPFNGGPSNTASYASDSSAGSIPDFPVPESQQYPQYHQMQSQALTSRRTQLGPPPSARRRPSSYYSRSPFVVPIKEETERSSQASYASSAVIPGNIPSYYDDDAYLSDEEPPHGAEDGRTSRAEDHDDRSGLVRQASTGRKTKAAIVPIRGESLHKGEVARGGIVAQAVTSAGAAGGAFAAGLGASRGAPRGLAEPELPPLLTDRSDSDTLPPTPDARPPGDRSQRAEDIPFQDLQPSGGNGKPFLPATPSPLTPKPLVVSKASGSIRPESGLPSIKCSTCGKDMSTDALTDHVCSRPRMAAIISDLEKGGALGYGATRGLKMPREPPGQSAPLRRPPRLNIDAVRDAEARGSLTSLPDLIRRATRLAGNLDRGKTASRLGMEGFLRDAREGPRGMGGRGGNYRNSGSLSDVLKSFSPPALANPSGTASPSRRNPRGRQGAGRQDQQGDKDEFDRRFIFEKPGPRARKKCCGIPLWLFILLIIVVIAIIVAAIVAPILIVLGDKSHDSALSSCRSKLACKNGGSSTIAANDTCSCLCTNGFTGSQCTTESDSSCSSTTVAGAGDATVGSAIPRLLEAARSNFSIPLDGQKVLAEFSTADVSCNTENALVTLGGRQQKRMFDVEGEPIALAQRQAAPAASPSPTEDAFLSTPVPSNVAQTTNGILIASGSPGDSGGAPSAPTGSPTGGGGGGGGGASNDTTDAAGGDGADFARVAILFVLQETGSFESASAAQSRLSLWFSSGGSGDASAARNVSIGVGGWSLDLVDARLTVPNGTEYGRDATAS